MRSAAVVAVVFGFACGKPAPESPAAPAPDPEAVTAIAQLGSYRDQVCACRDDACDDAIAGERALWLAGEHGRYRFTDEQRADADRINAAYDACRRQPNQPDDPVAMLEDFADRMCACKDKACADRVIEDMMEMGERYRDTKATAQQMRAATAITEQLTRCMMQAMNP